MAIPDYESLMFPVLRQLADGKERRVGELVSELAKVLHMVRIQPPVRPSAPIPACARSRARDGIAPAPV